MNTPATFERVLDYFMNPIDLTRPPVWFAVSQHSIFKLSHSLCLGAPVDALAPDGRTPLMIAFSILRLDIAEMLMGSGADIDQRDAKGLHALDHCTRALDYYLRYEHLSAPALLAVASKIEAFFIDFGACPDDEATARWDQLVRRISQKASTHVRPMHLRLI